MGSVNLDNTGSGSAITLSSDGTDLLLDGTAIGGGGGGSSPDLFAENYDGTSTKPSATGANAIALGYDSVASGSKSLVLLQNGTASGNRALSAGFGSTASGTNSVAFGSGAVASGNYSYALGSSTDSTHSYSVAMGYSSQALADYSIALGRSHVSGEEGFAAQIGDSTTSYGATGTNSVAIGKLAKTTASESIAIGHNCFASGANSVSIAGYYARSEAIASVSIGNYSLSENEGAVAIGSYSQAKTTGKLAFNASNSGSMSHGVGYQQRGLYVLKTTTADATQTVLTGNGSTPSASNSWVIGLAAAQAFSGTLIARQDRDGGHDYAAWEIKGAAIRNATVVDLGQAIINSLYHTSGASAWAVNVSANTTLGTIEIKVTGAASTDIDWVATIDTSEVVNI